MKTKTLKYIVLTPIVTHPFDKNEVLFILVLYIVVYLLVFCCFFSSFLDDAVFNMSTLLFMLLAFKKPGAHWPKSFSKHGRIFMSVNTVILLKRPKCQNQHNNFLQWHLLTQHKSPLERWCRKCWTLSTSTRLQTCVPWPQIYWNQVVPSQHFISRYFWQSFTEWRWERIGI